MKRTRSGTIFETQFDSSQRNCNFSDKYLYGFFYNFRNNQVCFLHTEITTRVFSVELLFFCVVRNELYFLVK